MAVGLTSDTPVVGTNKHNALGADEARTYAVESDEFLGLAKIKRKSGDVLAVAIH